MVTPLNNSYFNYRIYHIKAKYRLSCGKSIWLFGFYYLGANVDVRIPTTDKLHKNIKTQNKIRKTYFLLKIIFFCALRNLAKDRMEWIPQGIGNKIKISYLQYTQKKETNKKHFLHNPDNKSRLEKIGVFLCYFTVYSGKCVWSVLNPSV